MGKQTFYIQPWDLGADALQPLSGYWLRLTKNNHAVMCVAPAPASFLPPRVVSFSLDNVTQLRYREYPNSVLELEVSLASGSVYSLYVAEPATAAPVPYALTVAGPCCDDPYPTS